MKTCTKCKIEKDLSEFYKDKAKKDGSKSCCKSCEKETNKKWREENKEHLKKYREENKESSKKYREENKEHIRELNKKWREENKERKKELDKKWYENNKEHKKEYNKKHKEENKEHYRKYHREYQRNLSQTNDLFRLKKNLRKRTWAAFKSKGYSKDGRTQELLGVDWEVAKQHIERQFTKGMNWGNYGEWHIDHIIPLSSAKTPERLKKLCHYSNLQPLWAEDNLEKKDKIIGQQVKFRI